MSSARSSQDVLLQEFARLSERYPSWKILASGTIQAPNGKCFYPYFTRASALTFAVAAHRVLAQADAAKMTWVRNTMTWCEFLSAIFNHLAQAPDNTEDAGIALSRLVEALAHRLEWADVLDAMGTEGAGRP